MFRNVFPHLPSMVIVLDPTLAIVDATNRWLKSVGLSREEVVGRPVHEIVTGEPSLRASLERVLATREPNGADVPILGDDGRIEYILHTVRGAADVERARLRQLFMEAPASLALVRGPRHVFELANARYCELVGKSAEQLLGREGRAVLPELVDQGVWGLLDRVYASGLPYNARDFAVKLDRRGDGTLDEGYFDFTLQPTYSDDGLIDGVMILAVEVTAQVYARRALEAALDRVPVPLVLVEPRTARILLSNRAADALWGTPLPKPHAGEYAQTFRMFDEHGRPLPVERMPAVRAANGEDVVAERIDFETPRGRVPLLVDSARIPALPGHPAAIVVSFQDVGTLVAAQRAKDEFLAILGHELRNPLAPMLTALALVQRRGATPREIEVLERQVRHLGRLVDDLLDVSRISRGAVELRREPVDVTDAIARALDVTAPLLAQRSFTSKVDGGLVVDGDVVRLAQVFSNVLSNAVKYTPPDARIELVARRDGDEVVVSVRDEGVGIDPWILPRVFDMFVQAPQTLARAEGGLGLGLSIVKSLVELHGGRVEARSAGRGRGTEVVVRLPLYRPEAATSDALADVPPPEPSGRHVLVVDDNEDAADLLAMALTLDGFQVEVAHDPEAALEVASKRAPDAVLLDVGLPGMSGYELGERMHALPGLESTPLVAVTGYGRDVDRQRSRAAGFAAHLVKPVEIDKLRSTLETVLPPK